MTFNNLLSFLPVAFSFAIPPALLLFLYLPHFFPTIIHPVEIISLSLFLSAFLLPPLPNATYLSLLFSFLFLPHFYQSILSLAWLPCFSHTLSPLSLIPACQWLSRSLCTLLALLPAESWSSWRSSAVGRICSLRTNFHPNIKLIMKFQLSSLPLHQKALGQAMLSPVLFEEVFQPIFHQSLQSCACSARFCGLSWFCTIFFAP